MRVTRFVGVGVGNHVNGARVMYGVSVVGFDGVSVGSFVGSSVGVCVGERLGL